MYAVRMTTVEALPPERPIHGQMVLLPTPPPGGFTAADLPRLIEAVDARFELLDGEVLMMAPATHWHDEEYEALYEQALRTVDDKARIGLVHRMQSIEYERGPYIVAAFLNNVSGYDSRLTGYSPYPNCDGASGYNFYEIGFTPLPGPQGLN